MEKRERNKEKQTADNRTIYAPMAEIRYIERVADILERAHRELQKVAAGMIAN